MVRRPRVLRPLIYGLLALSSFVLVSSWIRTGVPWPEGLGVRAELQAFAETRDDDAIYLGVPLPIARSAWAPTGAQLPWHGATVVI